MEKCEEYKIEVTDKLTPSPDFVHCLQDYVVFGSEVLVLSAFIYYERKLWYRTHPFHMLAQLLDIQPPITIIIYSTTITGRILWTRITIQGSSSIWLR